MQVDLLKGNVTKSILLFSLPLILGNLLQQFYNIADTLMVGRFLGADALAAVGSSFTLMVFLTSVILGLCMGSGALFSILFGAKKQDELKASLVCSFFFIGTIALLITILVLAFLDSIIEMLQTPLEIRSLVHTYLQIIFCGIIFTFIYNYFASLLRAFGNSAASLIFLGISSILNIILDFLFILVFSAGIAGAAWATVISQAVSAAGIAIYCFWSQPALRPEKRHLKPSLLIWKQMILYSLLTSMQQSVMNFGILMIQGLVNSFGVTVMAAFAAAVKIDAFAYMPLQDFGNGFSTFIAQNYGSRNKDRLHQGMGSAFVLSLVFGILLSAAVCFFAEPLMGIFISAKEADIISIGASYLRIEGAFYFGIGFLFLWYGFFRGIGRPGISVVLTVISLGLRVLLAYTLSPTSMGICAIWWAIPVGWILADLTGLFLYQKLKKSM